MLRDATQRALMEFLNSNGIEFHHLKSESALTLPGAKAKILLRSMEEPERLRGTNLAWFGLDELTYTKEDAWLRLEGRLRDPKARSLSGFGVWTPKGFDWVYKRFIVGDPNSYGVIHAHPRENKFLLSSTPDFYDRLRKTYDEQFYLQEVEGLYVSNSGGLVYRNFSRGDHLRECRVERQSVLLWALDFNVDPMCSVVVQKCGDVICVIDEIVLTRASTAQACEEFVRRYGTHPAGFRIYGDASGNNLHTTGSTDYQIVRDFFRSRGLSIPEQRVPRSNPLVKDRISLVNAKLRNADGEIGLYVDPRCRGLVADFEEMAFQEGTMIPDKDRDPKRSHLSDALGYVVWQEFQTGPAGPQAGRIL